MTRTVSAFSLALLLPALAAAGPISVRLESRVHTLPGHDWVAQSVSAVSPDGATAADPAGPVLVSLLRIAPPDLPADDPGNPYRTGAAYYRDGYFTLTVRLTDLASGESGELSYGGRLHANYTHAGDDTYTASAYIWLGAAAQNTTLGGNRYTISPPDGRYAHSTGQFEVWVGPNAPAPLPEPGTLALVALGVGPAVWLRRRFRS